MKKPQRHGEHRGQARSERYLRWIGLGLLCAIVVQLGRSAEASIAVDLAGFRQGDGVAVETREQRLRMTWPAGGGQVAELVLDLRSAGNAPLFERVSLGARTIVQSVEPAVWVTVGERDMRAPSGWVAFFDNPPHRAYQTFAATLKKTDVRVTTRGSRTVVRVGELTAGGFRGAWEISVWRNSPMIFAEAVLSTEQDGRAILYDAGLVARLGGAMPWNDPASGTYSPLVPGSPWRSMAWLGAEGKLQRAPASLDRVAAPLQVARRMLVGESEGGAIAVFPPPHQYFYPMDSANNLGFVWYGSGRSAALTGYGFGIRQPPEGDRIWVPWVNAPPKTEQRLGVFFWLAGDAARAVEGVSALTRGDRYKRLDGYRTMTSHYHIEHTLELVKARTDQKVTGVPRGLEAPSFVKTFKARGIDIVHLGEFHTGAFPRMPAKDRLPLLKTLHEECNRLSDTELLVLPGEEPNVHLGGHWMSFFPKPVYWVLNRAAGEPFVEEVAGYGKVYRVGSPADVLELMEREGGLMWTAHARIKGSRGFPDAYWEQPFFRSERFFGAAWKAMPADLSEPRLGRRVLDLLDELSNAGRKKYALAEADMFRMEPDYESYAHLNINYVKLAALPKFADGWAPVLAALRDGKFFATTGEVLLPEFRVNGKESGDTLARTGGDELVVEAAIEGTFPLAFAEIVSGDGKTVFRDRIELSDTESHATRRLRHALPRGERKWLRLEVWDVARNGAFTQPVWLE